MSQEQLSAFLKCLKQLGTSSEPNTLQGEYNSLSKRYKIAQQRLLELQNSLMEETLFSERQSSLIQLLKEALAGQMEDSTIITFLRSLGEQLKTDPNLIQTMMEIEKILETRARKGEISKQGKIVQMSIRCEELETEILHLANKISRLQFDLIGKEGEKENLNQQILKLAVQLNQQKQANSRFKIQNTNLKAAVKQYKCKVESFQNTLPLNFKEISALKKVNDESLETIMSLQENWKDAENKIKQIQTQLKAQSETLEGLQSILGKQRSQMQTNLSKLVKNYQYLSFKVSSTKEAKPSLLFNSLKQFLSMDALKLVQEIEQNTSSSYLYRELQELCNIEKQQLVHYRSQERQMRRYKLQLMRVLEGDTVQSMKELTTRSRLKDLNFTEKFGDTSQFRL